MKATIEQLLKPIIKADIQSLLTAYATNSATELYTLKLTNDIRHQDKNDSLFTISSIITTGDDRPSGTKDVMAWNKSLMLIFRVDVNYIQQFAGIIKDYCDATWDRVSSVTDTRDTQPSDSDITYQYRFTWQSAKPQGEPYSIVVKANSSEYNEQSIMVREFVVIGSIFYSSNLPMEDSTFSIYLENGTEPDPSTNTWENSTEEVWNATDESNRLSISVNDVAAYLAWAFAHPATGYDTYTALRVFFVDTSLYYYKLAVASGTMPTYAYIPLLGRIKGQSNLAPAFTPTKLVEQTIPKYDLDAVGRTKAFSVQRILNNVLHDHLLNLYYSSDSATMFDCVVKMTVASLSISKYYNAKINGINYDDDPTETISFSVIILDEIVS